MFHRLVSLLRSPFGAIPHGLIADARPPVRPANRRILLGRVPSGLPKARKNRECFCRRNNRCRPGVSHPRSKLPKTPPDTPRFSKKNMCNRYGEHLYFWGSRAGLRRGPWIPGPSKPAGFERAPETPPGSFRQLPRSRICRLLQASRKRQIPWASVPFSPRRRDPPPAIHHHHRMAHVFDFEDRTLVQRTLVLHRGGQQALPRS